MEYFFLLLSLFTCEKRNFWSWKIKVLLVVLTLANMTCANRRLLEESISTNIPQEVSNSNVDPSCGTCGIANIEPAGGYVIAGTPVQPPYKYPWMVSLFAFNITYCGGSIISHSFILTAAHCLMGPDKKPITPNYGLLRIRFLTDTRELSPGVKISDVYIHPQYDPDLRFPNDIGLIKLENKITCDKYKSPICIPPESLSWIMQPTSIPMTVAGWGASDNRGIFPKYPNELLQAHIQTVECKKCSVYSSLKPKTNACTEGLVYCGMGKINQSVCSRDSGSPMFFPVDGKFQIGAIVQGGDSYCRQELPSMFTSVIAARAWIKEVAGI